MVPVGKPIDLTREGAPSHSLISNSSLDEFEDIHAKAKSILNKGNFSFGHKFYVEEEGKEIYQKSTSNDNDTFDLEDDSNQEYQVPKFNPPAQELPEQHSNSKPRKAWNKKPKMHNFDAREYQFDNFGMSSSSNISGMEEDNEKYQNLEEEQDQEDEDEQEDYSNDEVHQYDGHQMQAQNYSHQNQSPSFNYQEYKADYNSFNQNPAPSHSYAPNQVQPQPYNQGAYQPGPQQPPRQNYSQPPQHHYQNYGGQAYQEYDQNEDYDEEYDDQFDEEEVPPTSQEEYKYASRDEEDQEDEQVQEVPPPQPPKNVAMEFNFENTLQLKKKEVKKDQFLKRREEQQKIRKEELAKKKLRANNKDSGVRPLSGYSRNTPQSAKSIPDAKAMETPKNLKANLKKQNTNISPVNNPITSPITELKKKVQKQNLMHSDSEEHKGWSPHVKEKSPLFPGSKKPK